MAGPIRTASVVAADGQLSTTFGDEVVILSLDDGTYYAMADVGARVWSLVQHPVTVAAIVDTVVSEYDVGAEQAEADVQALLAELQSRRLVVITPSNGVPAPAA